MMHGRLTTAVMALVCTTQLQAADPGWVERSNEYAQSALALAAKYNPERAVSLEAYDENISDLTHDSFGAWGADASRVIGDYRNSLAAETDPKVRQDLEILIEDIEKDQTSRALARKYFFPFYDVTRLVYGAARTQLDPRMPAARQATLLVRLAKYAGTASGFQPIAELAKRRTLERIEADPHLLGPYRGEVEQAIRSGPALLAGIKTLLVNSGLRGWEADYAALERQLTEYGGWIESEILPRARSDNRLPAEVYADDLRQAGVDVSPEEMIARGLTAFAEIRNQMSITARLIAEERDWAESDYRSVIRRLKTEQIAPAQLVQLYSERLADMEALARTHRVVTLPERKAVIRLATDAENAENPVSHMNPPRLIGNTGEYGEFVVSTGMVAGPNGDREGYDDFSHQAYTWSLVAHEARPGHELQYSRIIEGGVSIARAIFALNSVNREGWGLYAEAEMQPYEPLDGQLFTLHGRAWRAARAFLDPMVNLGQIEPDDVVSFFTEELEISKGMATQEMQRFVFRDPGQATAYLYGYQRLLEIREAAQLALRDKFDRLAFNDFVLEQGLLPPRLLRRAVMDEFVPSQH